MVIFVQCEKRQVKPKRKDLEGVDNLDFFLFSKTLTRSFTLMFRDVKLIKYSF